MSYRVSIITTAEICKYGYILNNTAKKVYICIMGTINDIKSIFIGLSAYQQEQVLDGLLQEHEVQGHRFGN